MTERGGGERQKGAEPGEKKEGVKWKERGYERREIQPSPSSRPRGDITSYSTPVTPFSN